MGKHFIRTALTVAALGVAGTAGAGSWTLDGSASKIQFGSVKNQYNGEAHFFDGLSGTVSADGMADVEIDLTSVETYVDIRNERMLEFVFNQIGTAGLAAEFDMAAMEALAPGESLVQDVDVTLNLLGEEVAVFAPTFIMRVSDDKVIVTSDEMIYLATDELGIDAGIDKLQEIAGLDNIARSVPFTFRLMFTADETSS